MADTDWPQILGLYGLLERMTGNPMVTLNRAVAAAMVHGPPPGWRCSTARRRLAGHYRLDAVRGHLLELAGDPRRPPPTTCAAASRTTSTPERAYLTTPGGAVASRVIGRDGGVSADHYR